MEESLISTAFDNIKSKLIEYDTQFNTQFRPITDTQITTVEISPTGSGKNNFYKDSSNTLMLMPSNAMVIQNGGLVSTKKAEELQGQGQTFRIAWNQIDANKCDYMTYDKFYGHVVDGRASAANFNIIIDEAHLLFASDNERYQKLAKVLLDRTINFKELKLISATLRVESFALFNHTFDMNVYQKKDFAPHVYFTRVFPKVEPKERTLIFINSIDKMYQIENHLTKQYEGIKIMTLSSGSPLPSEQEIEEYNVIMSTSVIRQGYSIENTINKIIIYNVNNSEGAIGILQYMARPRNQTPAVYVIMAKTHFNLMNRPEAREELVPKEFVEDIIKKQAISDDENTTTAIALAVESWAAKVHQAKYFNNPVLSNYLFEKEMKNIELYMTGGEYMRLSINSFLPHATIDVDAKLKTTEAIKFTKLDISDYKEKLLKLETVEDVQAKVLEFIEEIKDAKDIEKVDKKRIIEKLEKISKVEPCRDFTMDDILYRYTDTIIVQQMVDEDTFKRCGWHKLNLKLDVNGQNNYTYRDKVVLESKKDRLLNIADQQEASKITHKFKKMRNRVKASKAEGVKLLERMYIFDKYYTDAKTKKSVKIKAKTSNKTEYVIITSLYTVKNSWYFKANP
ncbi:MAG: hypothetical protein RQ763_04685 [Sulfurimonas sp.]|uniref:DEAD/DEAH box helicase n=1 Tax=Sulfurimonas sp. TaxID=2022749 RepID=UPI0028CBDF9F|nr:hypothetical protein [Sulfurimonas sp.]MDT8338477.1 hypothetical protein [Sulfurimonas sp.]